MTPRQPLLREKSQGERCQLWPRLHAPLGRMPVTEEKYRYCLQTNRSIAAGPRSIWRYADLLPAPEVGRVDLGAGG